MAKIITNDSNIEPALVSYSIIYFVIIGAIFGLIYLTLSSMISVFTCSVENIANISAIVIMAISIFVMIKMKMAFSFIISIASGISLIGLFGWTLGLPLIEVLFWQIALYTIAYATFSWITRINNAILSSFIIFIIIIVLRTILTL